MFQRANSCLKEPPVGCQIMAGDQGLVSTNPSTSGCECPIWHRRISKKGPPHQNQRGPGPGNKCSTPLGTSTSALRFQWPNSFSGGAVNTLSPAARMGSGASASACLATGHWKRIEAEWPLAVAQKKGTRTCGTLASGTRY